MKRVSPAVRLPQSVDDQTFMRALRDTFAEHIQALTEAADGRLQLHVTVTTTYSAGENDHVIVAKPTAPFTITLPAASKMVGKVITIKRGNNTTHTVTINTSAGNIDGAASTSLTTAYQSRRVFSDGADYWLI